MTVFTRDIVIEAPVGEVWKVLADIGNIHLWNPGVLSSQVTTPKSTGLGACRHCNLGGKNYLDEEVVEWDVDKRLTMKVNKTNMPFKSVDVHFTLHSKNGSTVVTVSPEYEVKYGMLGKIMDLLVVRRTYVRAMDELLNGLKQYIETKK